MPRPRWPRASSDRKSGGRIPPAARRVKEGPSILYTGPTTALDLHEEIIVNAHGKYVAPAPIENALKLSHFVGQAGVLGNRPGVLAALLIPDFEYFHLIDRMYDAAGR